MSATLTPTPVVTTNQKPQTVGVTRPVTKGNIIVRWLTSTDHKIIGHMYNITSMLYFLLGGVMALIIRAQLFAPGLNVLQTKEQYNQMFTMHGTIMLLMVATPLFAGLANAILPLQLGAPDVAFPRLNMLSFWLYFFGALISVGGFLTPQGAASFGWFAYAPLSTSTFSPGIGSNMWVLGLAMGGFGTILGAVNFITTILTMRAPGMTMFRMSVFSWNILITSILVILVFPILAVALFGLAADRIFGAHVYDAATGGAILWQHMFWFFGHPEVYILALPFFGVVSEIIPVFSRKPIFGYKTLVYATISIGALSMTVWAHHMYVTGSVLLPFFALLTMLIAVPTGVKIFNWIGTMFRGSVTFETPMMFAIAFVFNFVFGGLTGIILASPVLDFPMSDSYFVVAHFHYVIVGALVFALFGAFYFWWPKWTGKMLNERLGMWHFWLLFISFHMTFLVQHWLGVVGMPRRYATYLPEDGFTWMNQLSTIGAFLMAVSLLPWVLNVYLTARYGAKVTVNDPWGYGRSLEWATSCPPPRHNFTSIPRIRSESPAFDLNHPELAPSGYTSQPALAGKVKA
ncbi:cytochrome c oxidase subunit 1 [Aurantimicrobium minutum]|jgi:cytochrome c oxidase subunit 1|uniref:Cytochrome c oxidase subunit 1 n=1 Tax=Aurantimicrobium photophilum TaxID=1987356 RepID=A0A2Z3RZG1_9MICO|nr:MULTISPECIES: cytochrome c oxidase subunit I [Aurantimicrobium]AWR21464.1 Cytochrome c oxidase subunit 1 [Aurantimicrobium photophilum]MDF9810055.1 cytochrome c oxidase subunit 1 [Aurantimicrobium minutum]MDH6424690.1 cytochrome c oxidase subunit 1 [Aurantimicrobium minutum]